VHTRDNVIAPFLLLSVVIDHYSSTAWPPHEARMTDSWTDNETVDNYSINGWMEAKDLVAFSLVCGGCASVASNSVQVVW